MALVLFIICVCFMVIMLTIALVSKARARYQQRITIAAELRAAKENEHRLQEELHSLQTKLQQAAKDPVTGLISWQVFEDRLQHHIRECERYKVIMGVMLIDIDEFKTINDGLNYASGDLLLSEVGQRIQSCIRQVDSLTRFTKDTFVVLLTQLSKPETAALVAQRVLQCLTQSFQINQNELYITACIGISLYPIDGDDASGLLRSADHALHLAKEKGKHVYQFYQEKMHEQSQRELFLNTCLNREAFFQELMIYYMPIVNAQNNHVICLEAQLHWQHAELGSVDAHELFHLAEKQRKLNAHSEWLLQHACRQFLNWREQGFHPQYIGFPLSIKQLENSHFIYRLSHILQDLNFNPNFLLINVRETTAQVPFDILEKAFNMLKYLGVKIGIDHFGSGSFSLSYLNLLPLDYIKLDPIFIEQIVEQERACVLLRSIIDLAGNLSIQAIAQGVNTPEQVLVLKELGCMLLQGPALSKAVKGDEVNANMLTPTS